MDNDVDLQPLASLVCAIVEQIIGGVSDGMRENAIWGQKLDPMGLLGAPS